MEPISQRDDEIDLFELFESIWEGKWKIIAVTLATGLIGLAYALLAPKSLSGSLAIEQGRAEVFYKYVSLNQQLADNDSTLVFDSENIFNEFVSEFRDYDEIISAVANHSSQYQSFTGSKQDQADLLISLAKQFEIIPPGKNDTEWQVRFKWDDEAEAKRVLADALANIVQNVKTSVITRTEQFAQALDMKKELELEKKRLEQQSIERKVDLEIQRQKHFLAEQALIARELDIATNQLGSRLSNNGIEVSVQATEAPYYLRGYKAIEKEIELINQRKQQDNYLQDDDYITTQQAIFDLQKDVTAEQILRSVTNMAQDSSKDWITYRMELVDIKNDKKRLIAIIAALFIGGMIGIFYVLIQNAYRKRIPR